MEYTQKDRPLRVETVLGEDALLLEGYQGAEALSRPFAFTLELLSTEPALDGQDILGTPLSIFLRLPGGDERTLHGRVRRFSRVGRWEELTRYRAEVVPWLWFLSLTTDSRIFQQRSVPEIVETIFTDLGWSDFEIRCTRSYPTREFCVQYRETHLDFVSRLLEEEGIFYFWEHDAEKHTLVLADDNSAFDAVEGGAFRLVPQEAPLKEEEDVVRSFSRQQSVNPNKVRLRDYDYLQPSFNLEATLEGALAAPEAGSFEVYDHPGAYLTKEEGERYARLRLEAREALNHVCEGQGTVRAFRSGGTFELRDGRGSPFDGTYLLTHVTHEAVSGAYRAGERGFEYRTAFRCMPSDVPFRPERVTARPVVHGTQTALVVGKGGEEIWVDKHGRIKIQFHWDRRGQKDENSSCWVRVAVPWGGKGWGAVSLPRIGNEVVVAFEEGDPDRPLVVGSVYNAEQAPPFPLPDSGIRMGMKSRSSPGGGGYNEITMTDTKGEEQVTIHAQFDMSTTVQNDQTNTVNNNRTTAVAVDDAESVGANQSVEVGGDRDVSVAGDHTEGVGGDQSVTVGGDRADEVAGGEARSVAGTQEVAVGADRSVSISGNDQVVAGGNMAHGADGDLEISSGGATSLTAGTTAELSAGTTMDVSAGTTMKLSAGGSSIEIGPAGVKITTGAMVTIQGATIKLN
jgi:type VI secretion system secreted protein VgrG